MSVFDMYETEEEVDTIPAVAPGSWWLDPAGNSYLANSHGYFELIFGVDETNAKPQFKFDAPESKNLTPDDSRQGELVDAVEVVEPVEGFDYVAELARVKEWAEKHGFSHNQIAAFSGPIISEHGKTREAILALEKKLEVRLKGEDAHRELFNEQMPAYKGPDIDITPLAAYADTAMTVEEARELLPAPELPVIVDENGEVLNAEEVLQALGLDDERQRDALGIVEAEQFAIHDENTANWFVSKIRERQDRADRIALMASLGIAEQLKAINGMLYRYGGELKAYCQSAMPRHKDGSFRGKNLKFTEGAVFFRKQGGWRCSDRVALQNYVDGLTSKEQVAVLALENIQAYAAAGDMDGIKDTLAKYAEFKSPLDLLPVETTRKFHINDMIKFAKGGVKLPGIVEEPVSELATMNIGGAKAWSITKLKDALKLKTEHYKLLAEMDAKEDNDA